MPPCPLFVTPRLLLELLRLQKFFFFSFKLPIWPDFQQFWPMFRDFLGGGAKWDPCLHIFGGDKIHPFFGWHIPVHLHMWSSFPQPPPPGPRGTQIILISSIYGMQRYENFATTLWKKCWKGAPFWKGNFNWNTRVKGHPASAPLARVPAGLPTLSP